MRSESDALPSPQVRRAKRQDVSEGGGDHEAFGKRTPPPFGCQSASCLLPFSHTDAETGLSLEQSASLALARNCEEPRSRGRVGSPYFRAMQPSPSSKQRPNTKNRGRPSRVASTPPPPRPIFLLVLPVTLSCLCTFGFGWCTAQLLLLGFGGFRWMLKPVLLATSTKVLRTRTCLWTVPNVYEVC